MGRLPGRQPGINIAARYTARTSIRDQVTSKRPMAVGIFAARLARNSTVLGGGGSEPGAEFPQLLVARRFGYTARDPCAGVSAPVGNFGPSP